MRYLPIHIDLQDAEILIIGGGALAEAKLRTLILTPAKLFVVSPHITAGIQHWIEQGTDKDKLIWLKRRVQSSDFTDKRLVYLAEDHNEQQEEIIRLAQEHNILINVADNKSLSRFISPAIIDRTPVCVSVGTQGRSPAMARLIKAEIEAILPANLGPLTDSIGTIREKLFTLCPQFPKRLAFWKTLFKGETLNSLSALGQQGVQTKAEQGLQDSQIQNHEAQNQPAISSPGRVTLVGAGPGSADLLTQEAARHIAAADVIVYDRLVSQSVLNLARREGEYIYVGKAPGAHSVSQNEINDTLVHKAQNGLHVVRLKGGDPLIFGRADEEITALKRAGIAYEICPGITAAAAAAAAAQIPLTTRGINTSLTLLSGHDTKGYVQHDWKRLAQPKARAVIYMGVRAASEIQKQLLAHGADPDMAVTIVENVSLHNQNIIHATLSKLVDALQTAPVLGPAVLMLGYAPISQT